MTIFQLIGNLFRKKENAQQPVSADMQSALKLWRDMYQRGGKDPDKEACSLSIPAGISSEFARLMLAESEVKISGDNARASYIDEQFQAFWNKFSEQAEIACALGSMALKPYISGKKIIVDLVRADRYIPTVFDDSGNVTAAVFMERKVIGKRYYTRLEFHQLDADTNRYSVENRAYSSWNADALGTPCELSAVDGWESLSPYEEMENIEAPLFAVFRIPSANRVDMDSPVGVSVFAGAVELIHEANEQWDKILWEYAGTELAVDASIELFDVSKFDQKRKFKLPKGGKRLYRKYDFSETSDISKLMQVFSPAIRDSSLFNGLNHILQRIEFSVGLAYGTISEPQDIEKTAEEIRSSKQRSYVHVSAMQRALGAALERLVYAMDVYATLYELATPGEITLSCDWGDSVLEDANQKLNMNLTMTNIGAMGLVELRMRQFGETEEDAKKKVMQAVQEKQWIMGSIPPPEVE